MMYVCVYDFYCDFFMILVDRSGHAVWTIRTLGERVRNPLEGMDAHVFSVCIVQCPCCGAIQEDITYYLTTSKCILVSVITYNKFKVSDFAFCFYSVYVQLQLLFTRRFFFIDTTCFGLTGHLQVSKVVIKESTAH
jgi:hypothetical protein